MSVAVYPKRIIQTEREFLVVVQRLLIMCWSSHIMMVYFRSRYDNTNWMSRNNRFLHLLLVIAAAKLPLARMIVNILQRMDMFLMIIDDNKHN